MPRTATEGKGKVPLYSLPSVGPGADPGVQAVSPQVTLSHPPGGRLPLLSTGPTVTFLAEERHRPSAGTKLYCLGTEVHAGEQLAQGCYLEAERPKFEPATFWIASERSTVKAAFHDTDIYIDTDSSDTLTSLRPTRAISSRGSSRGIARVGVDVVECGLHGK